ncbi:unnamed protein product [Ostreobium quekettii]|uniref:Pseudouridine-5'-phosphate glycosidase n=1 Tax=Ostreobium quekettii TaxID=121088 RepID=A0A8S1JIW9_9CHLO|nr:unnamed protein product [Ostreobium quekettii]
MAPRVVLTDEVRDALASGAPVVALDSTMITHVLPYPQNLATALQVEEVVRSHGAVPATVAIVGGQPRAGLTQVELEALAAKGQSVRKTSLRDLPAAMAKGSDGATTVAATAFLAATAGIRVFVTGGIGGVGRGGEASMDVSADVNVVGRVPVLVVCAGAQSILDIPRTLEYLETQGICVAAYGSDDFPAFFTPSSGCRAPARVDTPEEAAALMHASLRLGLGSGVVLGVPIPEEGASAGECVEQVVREALQQCEEKNVERCKVTPFLLEQIRERSEGDALDANVAVINNNAAIGAQVAACLSKLLQGGEN